MSRTIGGALVLSMSLASGCFKRTVEVQVHDPGRVGVSSVGPGGLVPVLPADGLDRSVPLGLIPTGERPMVFRQGGQVAILWSPVSSPISVVDPAGVLPAQSPDRGIAMRQGWLYSTYNLTPKRILPDGTRADFSLPIVVTTPLANIAEAREVREPRRWPAYVFLPVGGAFTFFGGGFLAISRNHEEYQLAGITYLAMGIPLVVYGLVNALASTEYAPLSVVPGP